MDLIPRSPLSKQQMHEFFLGTMNDALRYGLTSVHDAATLPDAVAFYKECVKACFFLSIFKKKNNAHNID
jgi:hypothetical protein